MGGLQSAGELFMVGINVIITAALLIVAIDILTFYALAF